MARLKVGGNTFAHKEKLKRNGFIWYPDIRSWVQSNISVSRARSLAEIFGPQSNLVFELVGEGTEAIPDDWLGNKEASRNAKVEEIFAQANQRQRELENEKNKRNKGHSSPLELKPRKKARRKSAGKAVKPNRYEQERKARIKKAFEEDQQRKVKSKPSNKSNPPQYPAGEAVNWSVPNESPRYIQEPLGTRADFKRDSARNRSRSSKIKD